MSTVFWVHGAIKSELVLYTCVQGIVSPCGEEKSMYPCFPDVVFNVQNTHQLTNINSQGGGQRCIMHYSL